MDSAIIGSVLGFLGALAHILLAHFTAPTTGTNGSVTDGQTAIPSRRRSHGPDKRADAPLPYVALDILRASIRPVVTYSLVAAFLLIKWRLLQHALYVDHAPALVVLGAVWDDPTNILLSSTVAFWFGTRSLGGYRR